MVENIKMLVLESDLTTFNQIERVGNEIGIKAIHVMDGLAAIGLFRSGNFKLVLINIDPFFKPQGLRKTMTFLRFANRSNELEIGAFGNDISPSMQLTLLDFGVKSFFSGDIQSAELNTFVEKVSHKENFISILKQRQSSGGDSYPLDVERIIQLANEDSAFIKIVFTSFLEEVPEYFSELESCIDSQNKSRISQIAHKVKSPLNIAGVKNFMPLAENLENEIEPESVNWDLIQQSANDLTSKFKEAHEEVKEIIGK